MLGGDMVSTRNLTEGMLLEVLQTPLDATDRPLDMDRAEGRFMALCEGYLELAVYSKGRQVTLAGRALDTHIDTIGDYVRLSLPCLPGGLPLATHARYPYVVSLWLLVALGPSILVAPLSLPSLLIDSVATHPHCRRKLCGGTG